MPIIGDCIVDQCHLHRCYKVNTLTEGVFCNLLKACCCLRRCSNRAEVPLRGNCTDTYWKIKWNLLFDIEGAVIIEPGIDACFRACLREDDIIGMRISVEQIYRIRVRIATDIIANWTKLLLIESIAYQYRAKRLWILR